MLKFRRFNLELYDKNKHYVLMKNLSRDKGVYKFISKRFEEWLEEMPRDNGGFMIDCPYVVVRENKYIGMIGSMNKSKDGIIDLWCAIDKNERNKGNAGDILGEMTIYLIDSFKDIRLRVDKNNEYSKRSVISNGYVLDKEESNSDKNYDIYYYFGKKK